MQRVLITFGECDVEVIIKILPLGIMHTRPWKPILNNAKTLRARHLPRKGRFILRMRIPESLVIFRELLIDSFEINCIEAVSKEHLCNEEFIKTEVARLLILFLSALALVDFSRIG